MPWLEKLLRSKVFVWVILILVGLWPVWPIFIHPNSSVLAAPLKYILHHLGFVACVLLATVLTFTPLRVLFPKSGIVQALNRHRRLVGVSAFVYGCLHFTTHLLYETGGDRSAIPKVLNTAVGKPFQLIGMITLAILLVLAVTSINRVIKWLGGKRWKRLHRLAYVAAGLAAYHQIYAQKLFPIQVIWIFGPLAALELLRIHRQWQGARLKAEPKPAI